MCKNFTDETRKTVSHNKLKKHLLASHGIAKKFEIAQKIENQIGLYGQF